MERVSVEPALQVRIDRPQHVEDDDAHRGAHRGDHQERRVPSPGVRQVEPERDAQDLARGEGGHHEPHHAPARREGEQVRDDRHADRADDPTEQPRHRARAEQQRVRRRETAERRAEDEARVEEEEELLAVEPVGEARREQPRDPRAERVGRDDEPELRRADVQLRHQHRPEGRQDHEVEDDRELQEREDRDDRDLVARELLDRGGCIHPAIPMLSRRRALRGLRQGHPRPDEHQRPREDRPQRSLRHAGRQRTPDQDPGERPEEQ